MYKKKNITQKSKVNDAYLIQNINPEFMNKINGSYI